MEYEIKSVSKEPVVNIAIDTLARKKQALIFVNSKRSAQKTAADIAKETKDVLTHHAQLKELSQKILGSLSHPTDQCTKLAHAIERGVAFHHAGLASSQREDIENAFRAGFLKIICCTPTLAAGLDMPAFRTVLKELKRYSGSFGMQFIPVLEYQQMAGRAGRPGMEDYGEAIIIANTQKERDVLVETYIHGEVEDIYSKLAVEPVLRTYVLSLIATGLCRTRHDLVTFFSKTFWAHHYQDMPQLERIIVRVTKLLINYGFVTDSKTSTALSTSSDANDTNNTNNATRDNTSKSARHQKQRSVTSTIEFESAADLMEQTNTPLLVTPLGQRVSQLYIDPLSADHLLQGLEKEKITTFGIFILLCQTLEMRPLLRVKSTQLDSVNEFLFLHEQELLLPVPTLYDLEYENFFDAIKTTQYVLDWLDETGEDQLFEKYDIRPGEINAKNEILDWLLYCCAELSNVTNKKHHVGPLTKLRTRLQYGAKEDLLPLLALKGIGRIRARKMIQAQIRTIAELKSVDIGKLSALLGAAIATDLKKQVGINQVGNLVSTDTTQSDQLDSASSTLSSQSKLTHKSSKTKEKLSWQQELLH